MAAAQTVWSIDVGKSSLKAVKVHRERNSLEILAVDKINYSVEPSGIDAVHQSKEALRTFAARNVIDCPVVVSHPGHSAFSRFIQLPPVDAKKLEEMIGYEAQQQIPFPIDEVIWDYHVCTAEEMGAEKEVGIFAVRREVISDFMLDYESVGLDLEMISVGYLGLLNYVLFDLRPTKPSVVIDIGSDHSDLLIVDGRRFWIRSLAIAGNDVTHALQEKFKLQFNEAERLKLSASKSDQAVKIFGVVQPILKELVNEVHRSVGFYKSQAGDVKFEDVFLFGNACRLIGIKNYLQEHLRYRVHIEKGFHRIRVNRESNVALLQHDFPSFASAVGNAAQGLGEGECQVNLLPREQQAALDFRRKQKTVLVAAASLFILVAFLVVNLNGKIESARNAEQSMAIVGELQRHEKGIAGLEKQTHQELERDQKVLLGYAGERLEPYLAWKIVGELFESVPSAEGIAQTVEDNPERANNVSAIEGEMDDINRRKTWLTWVEVERVFLDAQGGEIELKQRRPRRTGTSAKPRGAKERLPADEGRQAYRVTLRGVRYSQGDEVVNADEVKQQIVAPLEDRLRSVYRMELNPGNQELVRWSTLADKPEVIYSRHPRVKDRPSTADKDRDQGATLYEFELRWYQPPAGDSASGTG